MRGAEEGSTGRRYCRRCDHGRLDRQRCGGFAAVEHAGRKGTSLQRGGCPQRERRGVERRAGGRDDPSVVYRIATFGVPDASVTVTGGEARASAGLSSASRRSSADPRALQTTRWRSSCSRPNLDAPRRQNPSSWTMGCTLTSEIRRPAAVFCATMAGSAELKATVC